MLRLTPAFALLSFVVACDEPYDTADGPPEIVHAAVTTASVAPEKELFLTHLSAVDDPKYVNYRPGRYNTDADGGWSFGRLIDNLMTASKPSDRHRSDFVMTWLRTWETPQLVNGQWLPPRTLIRDVIIGPWKQRSIGKLGNSSRDCSPSASTDFTCKLSFLAGDVPFDLSAIVFRPDLRVIGTGGASTGTSAGQGRFIFTLVDPAGTPLPFTIIFEYTIPADSRSEVAYMARDVHSLGSLSFGPTFNREVQRRTAYFMGRGVAPWRQNGSALLQIRTNDVVLAEPGSDPQHPFGVMWELREFVLGPDGFLKNDTMKLEPRIELSGTQLLADWVNANAADIAAGTALMPDSFGGEPLLAASSIAPFAFSWQVPGVSEELRHAFAIQTCNGCHVNETGTQFLHVFPLAADTEATLSPWLIAQLAPNGPRTQAYVDLLNTPVSEIETGPKGDHPGEDDRHRQGGRDGRRRR